MEALEIFSFCNFILGILTVCILIFISRVNPFSRYMLVISFFSLSCLMLTNYLLFSQNLFQFPHLFRISGPLTYLIFPCGFLYIRSVINEEQQFRTYDWIHFVPATLHIIELLPFYIKTSAFKQDELKVIMASLNDIMYIDEGLLPTYTHIILKVSVGLIYVILQFHIIRNFVQKNKIKTGSIKWLTCNWLRLLTFSYATLTGLILLIVVLKFPVLEEHAYLLVSVCLCLIFMITIFLLFFKPYILYGYGLHWQGAVSEIKMKEYHNQKNAAKKNILSAEQLNEYHNQIEIYLDEKKPYLRPGFSAKDMEKETNIPRHHLSMVINTKYKMHFNDLINKLRIDYVKHHLNLQALNHLTIEGIAEKAGFKSRTTFFHAVKKFTGLTPTTFIKNLKQ